MFGEFVAIAIILGFALLKLTAEDKGKGSSNDPSPTREQQAVPHVMEQQTTCEPLPTATPTYGSQSDSLHAAPISISRAGGGRFNYTSGRARIGR